MWILDSDYLPSSRETYVAYKIQVEKHMIEINNQTVYII